MLWGRWLKRDAAPPTRAKLDSSPVSFPAGICVHTERGSYLIHKDGKRYKIPTKAIEDSWSFPHIVDASEESLKLFPVALTRLGFRDGSLLNNIADGKLYLISGGRRRHVVDPAILKRMGINHLMARVVSDDEINMMKPGDDI